MISEVIEGDSQHPHRYHFRHSRIYFAIQFLTQEIHQLGVDDLDYHRNNDDTKILNKMANTASFRRQLLRNFNIK